ncbi:MAG: hypothetical protein ABEN55_09440, partial [Bradymonadaceae bacterium]
YVCGGAGIGLPVTIGIEMLMSAMGAGLLAATIDDRIAWAAVPYLVGGLVAVESPAWVFELNGATNLVAMGLLAWVWWPDDEVES